MSLPTCRVSRSESRARGACRPLAQWKALASAIADRWAIDRLREAEGREKYDAGWVDEADAYLRPTLDREDRDLVEHEEVPARIEGPLRRGANARTERRDSLGRGRASPHQEIADEIGVTRNVVRNRLYRMRATVRAKLAALGVLTVVLLVLVLPAPIHKQVGRHARSPSTYEVTGSDR
jgi:DNA-directed RNA polymerase specialized sigma24 family protein